MNPKAGRPSVIQKNMQRMISAARTVVTMELVWLRVIRADHLETNDLGGSHGNLCVIAEPQTVYVIDHASGALLVTTERLELDLQGIRPVGVVHRNLSEALRVQLLQPVNYRLQLRPARGGNCWPL